jgi:hypothetical protein
MPYIGAARLIITAVRPDRLVEGRMEFDVDSYVSTFADKRDSVVNTNRGVVSDSVLIIDVTGRQVRIDPGRRPPERRLHARRAPPRDNPAAGHLH